MERKELNSLLKGAKKLSSNDTSTVYKTNDGDIFKHFSELTLYIDSAFNLRLAEKIDYADKIVDFDELYKPTAAVYKTGHICGMTTKFNDGIALSEYCSNGITSLQKNNLYFYKQLFEKLTRLVKKAHDRGIVIPDICSCANILVNSEGNLSFIDYDGMQVDKYPVFQMSTALGKQDKYFVPKYYDEKTRLYSPELDKTSLLLLYFLCALNVNVAGTFDSSRGLDFNTFFELINLKDPTIRRMISDTLSSDKNGFYIDTIAEMMADKYVTMPHPQFVGSKILVLR